MIPSVCGFMKRLILLAFFIGSLSSVQRLFSQSKPQYPIPDKIVVLTFDDAIKSHYTIVAPILRKYGFGATFFICEFPPDFDDTTKYMTWAQIKQLSSWGFDIGNHTQHHVHVNSLSAEDLKLEIEYIDRKCESLQIPKPLNFAYPGYDTDSSKIETLKELGYVTARIGGDRVYQPGKDDPFFIPSFTPGDDLNKALDAIRQAKDSSIVILTIHGVPDMAHDWVSTSPGIFESYMKYLKDSHYKVISMRDLVAIISRH